ncbi:MAG: hypothetical protein JKY42_12365, partial [Flavobacteriales bacterium]|nr:hypothetical protein [Flavobacteriales bacterium]
MRILTKTLKKTLAALLCTLGIVLFSYGQQTGVNSAGTDSLLFFNNGTKSMVLTHDGKLRIGDIKNPNPSAILQLNSTTGGLLIPRMTTLQRDALINKVEGLLIYNTTNAQFEVYDGTSVWDIIFTTANITPPSWIEDADANTYVHAEESPNEDNIRFYTAGIERMVIDPNGNIGIGLTPNNLLEIGSDNQAIQAILTSNATNASTFILGRTFGTLAVPTAVGGISSLGDLVFSGYDGAGVQMSAVIQGLSSQAFTGTAWGTDLVFYTTPDNTTTLTEAMRISDQGNVGIGVMVPSEKLHLENGVFMMTTVTPPGTTTDRLYNNAGNLYWNGTQLNTAGSSDATSIQGIAVTTITPNTGQILSYNGGTFTWEVAPQDASLILTYPVTTVTPVDGKVLKYNGGTSQYELQDVNADFIQGFPVTTLTATDREILSYNGGTFKWETGPQDADYIRGFPITTVTPSDRKVLQYNSGTSQYELQDVNADFIQGFPVTTLTATDREILSYNGGTFKWETGPQDADYIRGFLVTTVTPSDRKVLQYNSGTSQYELQDVNADFIQGFPVTTLTATDGDILAYNGGTF